MERGRGEDYLPLRSLFVRSTRREAFGLGGFRRQTTRRACQWTSGDRMQRPADYHGGGVHLVPGRRGAAQKRDIGTHQEPFRSYALVPHLVADR